VSELFVNQQSGCSYLHTFCEIALVDYLRRNLNARSAMTKIPSMRMNSSSAINPNTDATLVAAIKINPKKIGVMRIIMVCSANTTIMNSSSVFKRSLYDIAHSYRERSAKMRTLG
jgi:hypothetical protein